MEEISSGHPYAYQIITAAILHSAGGPAETNLKVCFF